MSDLLLVLGVLLCVLSVVVAVVQLLQTQPPRAAAICLVAGIVALFAGAALSPEPFALGDIPAAFGRVTGQYGA
ncbi:MAG: hypothetical protein ACU0DH_12485 [Paracoccus sp. (in: a-proteobacteria)]|uniref:hypothetical protein n=1 Tax=Paracoccus sp. TaxID=267 RepID=UPI002E8C9BFF|nr:hypothetical protein [Pseudomonadota bacterium]